MALESCAQVRVSIAVVGEESAGKSSLCGALLTCCAPRGRADIAYRTQCHWSNDDLKTLRTQAAMMGRSSSWLAWIMDRRRSERERGRTVDGNVAKLETASHVFTLLDAPGKPKYWQKTVTMLCQADAALVLVPAKHGASADENARLLQCLGTLFMFQKRDLVIGVSHMDVVDHDESVFRALEVKLRRMMRRIGFAKHESIPIVPISVVTCVDSLEDGPAIDVQEQSSLNALSWYRGPGLLRLLKEVPVPPRKDENCPALVLFTKAYKIRGVGLVFCGCVLRGTVQAGDRLMLVPGCVAVEVRSVHFFHQTVRCAFPGMHVGLQIRSSGNIPLTCLRTTCVLLAGRDPRLPPSAAELGPISSEDIERQRRDWRAQNFGAGEQLRINANRLSMSAEESAGFAIPRSCRRFVADIRIVSDALGKHGRPLGAESPLLLHCLLHSARVRVVRIIAVLDRDFHILEHVSDPSTCAARGQLLRVELCSSTCAPVLVEDVASFAPLARIVLCDNRGLVAAGVVRNLRPQRSLRIAVYVQGHGGNPTGTLTSALGQDFNLSIVNACDRPMLLDVHLGLVDVRGQPKSVLAQRGRSSADLEVLRNFVSGGGSLLVLADDSPGSVELLASFGLLVEKFKANGRTPLRAEVCPELRRPRHRSECKAPISFQQWARAQKQQHHSARTRGAQRIPAAKVRMPKHGQGHGNNITFKGNSPQNTGGQTQLPNHLSCCRGAPKAWLSDRGLRIALEFAACPNDLAAAQVVCQSWFLAADDIPWRIASEFECAEECLASHLRWLSDDDKERLSRWAPRSPWKASIALYRTAVRSCAGLVDGSFGRVSHVVARHFGCTCRPVEQAHAQSELGVKFHSICSFGRRFGGGSVLMHLPRFAAAQSGQVLVACFPLDGNDKMSRRLLLNFAAEASRRKVMHGEDASEN